MRWPAIVSPFLATYACSTEATVCNLCECRECSFRFFDSRLTDAESQRLYSGYRGEAYFQARHSCEFWYSRALNDGIGGDPDGTTSRKTTLAKFIGGRAPQIKSVLDYGGDRGQFIPDGLGEERFVFEVSDAKPVDGVVRLKSVEGMRFDLVMLTHVLEHCSEPGEMLCRLRPLSHGKTLFYFEVPYERPSLRWAPKGSLQAHYLKSLLGARWLLQLVDLYSTVARVKFNFIPPIGLQKCSEHLNFFTNKSMAALLNRAGFELLETGATEQTPYGTPSKVLYHLATLKQ